MRRGFLVCCLILAVSAALPSAPTSAATGSAEWNQWGGNGGQTWSNDAETSISPSNASTLHLVWSRQIHLRNAQPPSVVGGSVYTVLCCHRDYCETNRLVRIPIDRSEPPWKYGDEYTTIFGAPLVGSGVAVVFDSGCSESDPRGYTAIHARTGRYAWTTWVFGAGFGSALNRGREYFVDGIGPNGTDPFTLTAYDPRTGSRDWTYGPFPYQHRLFQPRAAGDAVYIAEGSNPSSITALSSADGSLKWNVPGMVPFAALRDVVYASVQDDFLSPSQGITALDPTDGSVLWSRTGLDPYPRAAFSATVDVVSSPTGLVALDPNDGTTMWKLKGTFGQPTIANGVVFVRSSDEARILVLDGSTGARLTTIPGNSAVTVANGWVFTTTDHLISAYAP